MEIFNFVQIRFRWVKVEFQVMRRFLDCKVEFKYLFKKCYYIILNFQVQLNFFFWIIKVVYYRKFGKYREVMLIYYVEVIVNVDVFFLSVYNLFIGGYLVQFDDY